MNAYEIADQIINAPFDTNFDMPEIDTKGLRDKEVDEDAISEQEEIEAAAQKIADILAGGKAKKVVRKTAKVTKTAAPKAEKPAKAEKAAKTSKMDTAREMYATATDKSRKNIIGLFMAELGMSSAMASTYYYKIKGN